MNPTDDPDPTVDTTPDDVTGFTTAWILTVAFGLTLYLGLLSFDYGLRHTIGIGLELLVLDTAGELVALLGGLLIGWARPWRLLWTDHPGA